jgi:hypothetical protein
MHKTTIESAGQRRHRQAKWPPAKVTQLGTPPPTQAKKEGNGGTGKIEYRLPTEHLPT